jgi:hypothetical protein
LFPQSSFIMPGETAAHHAAFAVPVGSPNIHDLGNYTNL